MGIPTRFSIEYPQRCLDLFGVLEEYARRRDLVGSFSLLAAASVLTVPFERAAAKHFLHREVDDQLTKAIKSLSRVPFVYAPFWEGEGPVGWRQTHIVANGNDPDGWVDDAGRHPFDPEAMNVIGEKKADQVLRVLRNALAHGNIIYLNKDGREREGERLEQLAFLSRYEETAEQREQSETYRLITTTEEEFLRFVKSWAGWIVGLAWQDRDVKAA